MPAFPCFTLTVYVTLVSKIQNFDQKKRVYHSMRENSRMNSKRIEKFRDARGVRENSRALLPIPFAI